MLRREKRALQQKEIEQTLIASRRDLIEAERQEALAVTEAERIRVTMSLKAGAKVRHDTLRYDTLRYNMIRCVTLRR